MRRSTTRCLAALISFALVELWLDPLHLLHEHAESFSEHCDSHDHGECCADPSEGPEHDHPAGEHEDLPNPSKLIIVLLAHPAATTSLPPMVPGQFASFEQPALPSRLSPPDWTGPRGPPLGHS